MSDSFWGEPIHSYSRAQAIEDGVLVDLSASFPAEVKEAGIKFPIAMTAEAFHATIGHEADLPTGQDLKGRAWDVCCMFAMAGRQFDGESLLFKLGVYNGKETEEVTLKAMVGPGDDPRPVLTLMLEWQD